MRHPGMAGLVLFLVLAAALPALAQVAPIGAPFEITALEGSHSSPVLAARPDGTYLVVWEAVLPTGEELLARLLGPAGTPLALAFSITAGQVASPAVAVLPDGGFVVVWEEGSAILGAAFDRDGRPRAPRFEVASRRQETPVGEPAVAAGLDGGWMVVWQEARPPFGDWNVFGRRYAPDGTPGTAATALSADLGFLRFRPSVAARPDGGFLATWAEDGFDILTPIFFGVGFSGRRVDAAGVAVGSDLDLGSGSRMARLIPLPGGEGFVVADEGAPTDPLSVRRLDADGMMLPGLLHADAPRFSLNRAFAIDPAGLLLLVGTGQQRRVSAQLYDAARLEPLGAPFEVTSARPDLRPPVLASAQPGQFLMVWEDKGRLIGEVLAVGCAAPHLGLCLAQNRFRVEVSWRDHGGNTGRGHAVPLKDDTGAFWFFSPSNVELLVKVLDGRGVNGHFWVFYGSLSDVEYEIKVVDTATGDERLYRNPAGRLASQADVQAFPPAEGPAPAAAPVAIPGRLEWITAPLSPAITCSSSEVALCLDPLYRVTVDFADPQTGQTRQARAVPFSHESGAFWFFDRDNLELFVKVLDGSAVNGHAWVFHGALTDVEYTLKVHDLVGPVWTYHNPRGRMHSGADTTTLPPPFRF